MGGLPWEDNNEDEFGDDHECVPDGMVSIMIFVKLTLKDSEETVRLSHNAITHYYYSAIDDGTFVGIFGGDKIIVKDTPDEIDTMLQAISSDNS